MEPRVDSDDARRRRPTTVPSSPHHHRTTAPSAQVTTPYVASLYWSFTTMTTVGYGDLIPQSDTERLFAACAMIIGAAAAVAVATGPARAMRPAVAEAA